MRHNPPTETLCICVAAAAAGGPQASAPRQDAPQFGAEAGVFIANGAGLATIMPPAIDRPGRGGAGQKRKTMDLRKLKTLIDLVSESNISELEITEAEGKVRIVKAGQPAAPVAMAAMPGLHPAPAVAEAPRAAAPAESEAPAEPAGHVVSSPMVGTFYRASSPGGKPLVEVGSSVKEGEPVCIIEAMKIMNEIEATHTGTITEVLVENGQPVEFGQALFVIG
jgi:acetyl-CoA carboxylase biotin carboxyl carrier protein